MKYANDPILETINPCLYSLTSSMINNLPTGTSSQSIRDPTKHKTQTLKTKYLAIAMS